MRRRIGGALALAALAWSAFPGLLSVQADQTVPGAPTAVTAQGGTLNATVTWTPADSSATTYTVTSSPGGITTTVDASSNTATVTGLGFGLSYTFTVAGNNAVGTGPSSTPSNRVTPDAPGGPYHQGAARVLLNSDVSSTSQARFNLGADSVHAPGLMAVALNVTASQPSQATTVQVTVGDQAVQSIPVAPGTVQSSLAIIPAPAQLTQGAILVTAGTVHVQVDFEGFFTAPRTVRDHSGMFQAVDTALLLDDAVGPGGSIDIPVLGQGDVPASGVGGVLLNVTAIDPAAGGSFTVLPTGVTPNGTTTVAFAAGQTAANRVLVPLPSTGDVTLYDIGAGAGVRVDLLGWFTDGTDTTAQAALYTPVSPTRLVDASSAAAGASLNIPVWDHGGVPGAATPAPATSAILEISAQSSGGAGSIAVDGASVVVYGAGASVSGIDVVRLASTGGSTTLSVRGGAASVTVDLVGFMSGDLIIPGSTKVLTAAQLAAITNLGSDMTITFAPGAQISPPIRLDDVIAAGISPTTPHGFLRRVLSIYALPDGSLLFGTRHASILEALTAFTVEWAMPPNSAFGMSTGRSASTLALPAHSTNPFPPPSGTSIDTSFPALSIVKPPKGLFIDLSSAGLNASELVVNDLEIQALPHFRMSGNPFGTVHIAVGFSVGARAQLELSLLFNAVGFQNRLIWQLPRKIEIGDPALILVGGVIPLVLQVEVDIQVTLTLALDGGFSINYSIDRYGAVSGGYDGTNFFIDQPVYKDYLTPQQTVQIHPDVQAQAELDVHVIPQLDIDDGLGVIGADIRPFIRGVVDPFATPWWFVSVGVCRALTIGLDLFIHKFFTFPASCLELIIAHAPGGKPVITITPPSATVARSGTQHFHASVTNNNSLGVFWTVQEAGGGTLSNLTQFDVDYTAPRTAGTYHLHTEAVFDRTSTLDIPITVPPGPPTAPTNVVAALTTTTSAIVGWTAPGDDGGVPLSSYQVTIAPGGASVPVNFPGTTATFNNLSPATTYTFTVTATNQANLTSAPSAVSNTITTPPAGPMSVVPSTINFGTVTLGQSAAPQSVLVTAGGNPLVISTVKLVGSDPGEFGIQSDQCSGQTLQPGASCAFSVGYTPTLQIAAGAVVSITDSDSSSPQTVTLSGSSPVQAVAGVLPVYDIQMLDSQTGYALEAALGSAVLKTTDGGHTWTALILPPFDQLNSTGTGYNLRFVDAMHGFVSAYRQLQPSGRRSLILATSDGGQTWREIAIPSGLVSGPLWFTDSQHGWFMSGIAGPPAPPGSVASSTLAVIYATTDGGTTWTQQTFSDPVIAGTPGCIGSEGNLSVRFADSSNGWFSAVTICDAPNGVAITRAALVWTTSDGGTTWTVHQPSGVEAIGPARIQVPGASQMRQPGAINLSSNAEQVMVSSDDGGASFTATALPAQNGQPVATSFSDGSHGLLLTADGHVWRTADGGVTWAATTLPRFVSSAGRITSYGYRAMESPDGTNIWITGDVTYGFAEAGFIEHSSDGGATWTVQLLGS